MNFAERCAIAQASLPDAPYRSMLTKLHDEMLKELAQGVAAEREAIAKLFPQPYQEYFGCDIQDVIRARSDTPAQGGAMTNPINPDTIQAGQVYANGTTKVRASNNGRRFMPWSLQNVPPNREIYWQAGEHKWQTAQALADFFNARGFVLVEPEQGEAV